MEVLLALCTKGCDLFIVVWRREGPWRPGHQVQVCPDQKASQPAAQRGKWLPRMFRRSVHWPLQGHQKLTSPFLAFPEREKEGGSGRGKGRSRKSPETCERFKMREEVRRNEVNKSWTSKRG